MKREALTFVALHSTPKVWNSPLQSTVVAVSFARGQISFFPSYSSSPHLAAQWYLQWERGDVECNRERRAMEGA